MDSTLLYGGLGLLAATLGTAYTLLVLWSPDTIVPKPSEKTYRSPRKPSAKLPLSSIRDSPSVDLSVVIPAYNETARLPDMFSTTLAHLESTRTSQGRSYEVLIVDDGSRDGTADLALKLGAQYPQSDVRVVVLEKNLGKGGAVRHGMLHGRGRRLLMVDADGASRFEDLELLWNEMDEISPQGEAAVVVGSRAHLVKTEAVVKRSFLRNVLMYGLHTILRIVGVGHIRDTQCGFKLFSRRAAQQIFPYQHLPTWIFDVELLLLAKELHMPVAEVPIEWHEVGGSKLHVFADSLQMLRDLLILRANLLLGRWKVPRTAPLVENGKSK
ncbi:glycosyltransferase family 2 protein [Lentinus tigrinus ALCF2SS1-7]|uniref:dolichyl-phosphate beta-glucosyltransferase n=1 Tax=Lentinus tigrinus ALCF2SS1-6 TaxID=1328759 RepID=A0A5C2RM23_9APHY|nr:glycosyltransferase family 2 protein [Lentinus tigrinus ALCF2SS1-6]RPD73032.1 glycosyltransferase family 2 protein [Lentinus tigrinus ALCF2SS1-7]